MESGATSPTTDTVAMMTQQAEEQWRRAGGHVLPPFAPIACASRRAFALLQAAAALDQECARLRQELCEFNNGEDAGRGEAVKVKVKAGAAVQQVNTVFHSEHEMDDRRWRPAGCARRRLDACGQFMRPGTGRRASACASC